MTKIEALAKHLGCEVEEIEECAYGDDSSFEHGRATYRVLDNEEADQAWDESLESYIDDCMEIPKEIANYFDREAWKRDARFDGRGHSLSSYDGDEHEIQCEDGTWLYIYRTN